MRIALTCALSAIGLAMAMATGTASASPVVNWEYTVSSRFLTDDTTFNGAGPGSGNGCEAALPASITWGACAGATGRSSIGVSNNPQGGTLVTNGAAEAANTYTHSNNVVASAYAVLKSATIEATLGLKVQDSADPYVYTTAIYTILFSETPNEEGTCAAASPAGIPCNDIWVLDGSLNHTITFDGNEYFFGFFAAPALNALPDAVCAAAGAANGCVGFTTVENQNNAVDFLVRVTSAPLVVAEVPEPASITLLGAGLLGVAGMRRRRRNTA